MAKLYVLVGVPGSGKSTWVANQEWAKDCVYVSSDNHVEAYAKSVGKTYSEVFDEYITTAVKLMFSDAESARDAGKDIIWDQTSTSIKARKKKLNMLPKYNAIAVVFPTPDATELAKRLASRPGKEIPSEVMKFMTDSLVVPTEDEGFEEIWYT